MKRGLRAAATASLLLFSLGIDAATTHRSRAMRDAFVRSHPCPATGLPRGPCPGYVVDHVVPLCAGGPDSPANMQWQTGPEGKAKDRGEVRACRLKKH